MTPGMKCSSITHRWGVMARRASARLLQRMTRPAVNHSVDPDALLSQGGVFVIGAVAVWFALRSL